MSAVSQDRLREELDSRLRLGAGGGEGARTLAAFVVVARVDLPSYVAGAIEFAAGLKPPLAAAWLGAFTRTVFLAGDPVRIAARHPARQLAADGSAAWFGPADGDLFRGLRLLLKAFEAPLPPPFPERVVLDDRGPGKRRLLYVDVGSIGMEDYLIDLNHLVCEATIAGLLAPGAALELRHVEGIDDATGPFARTRVVAGEEGALRRRAALTEEAAG
jgi:hypothetical protein